MSTCEGRGDCIQQCCCTCFKDKECNVPSEICSCGHRNHTRLIGGDGECQIYCKKECPHNCKLVECNNYRMCGQKRPQNILDCHNGMCIDCAIMWETQSVSWLLEELVWNKYTDSSNLPVMSQPYLEVNLDCAWVNHRDQHKKAESI